ncbi:MAG: hypothetical protein KOO65_13820, partial [Desulfobacterales bacterium]|nr:hypothetical protein [Desulfobacterales bacterium]
MAAVTWNSADLGSSWALSNGDRTAAKTASVWSSARAHDPKSTGKWYAEVKADNMTATAVIGFGTSAAALNNFPGSGANGWGYQDSGSLRDEGGSSTFGDAWYDGDIIGIAVDMDTNEAWFSNNGVWQGAGSPDPATNTDPALTGIADAIMLMCSGWNAVNIFTISADSGNCTYSSPSGYDYWDDGAGPTTSLSDMAVDIAAFLSSTEDQKLDISAYFQSLEDQKIDISVLGGIIEDLQTDIHAAAWIKEDLLLDIAAYFQELEDQKIDIHAAAWARKDKKLDIAACVQFLESMELSVLAAMENTANNVVLDLWIS